MYREMMCRMWTNFAKLTDATPDDDDILKVKWKQVDTPDSNFNYLDISNHGNLMRQGLCENRVDFWRNAYDKYNEGFTNPKFQIVM